MTDGGRTVAAHVEQDRRDPPLCVDLDGTLVRSDVGWESVLQLLRRNPLRALWLPLWLARGRAFLKERIADAVRIDVAVLPYNEPLLRHLRGERETGRRVLLVTASHARPAAEVAAHLGVFDDVLATREGRNLKGRAKRDELVRRFGERGFDYAGDSVADLEVWPAAREAIAVDASRRVLRRLGDRAGRVISSGRRSLPRLVLSAIRVRQWVKNLLVFVPLGLAHRFLEPQPVLATALGFLSFSLGASAVYVLNDLLDVEADRHHPRKRRRPFASGELPLQAGFVLVPLLGAASLAAALPLPPSFLLVLGFYFVTTTLYSLFLKQVALLDVLVLAALFTTRILAGSTASETHVSEWLLAFSMFIFLSLAAVKRYAELLRLRAGGGDETRVQRRGYFTDDHELILQMGFTSGFMAVLVLALYISTDVVTELYSRPVLLWLVCPVLLFWVGRIWLLAHRGQVDDDPLMFAMRDWTTWVVALAGMAVLLAASRWA
jgi:4-hydroxybenzoate polyprenyltransferase/phosphoserine phosphatase